MINLTGLKKQDPVDERLQLAEELLPEIMDSAEKPLTVSWMHSNSFENFAYVTVQIYLLFIRERIEQIA